MCIPLFVYVVHCYYSVLDNQSNAGAAVEPEPELSVAVRSIRENLSSPPLPPQVCVLFASARSSLDGRGQDL